MAKDKLLVASTTPVDLDDDTKPGKDTSKETSKDSAKDEVDEEEDKESEVKEESESKKEEEVKKTEESKDTKKDEEEKEEEESKSKSSAADATEDVPPPPARPVSPLSRVRKDLQDAFPDIEEKYIQAVLIASQGQPDPAFSALLYLLDPSYVPDVNASAPPPVPPKQELTDDELLARKLQKEFEREDRRRRAHLRKKNAPPPGDESPDEIDQLKESFTQGFEEAKSTINGWVLGLSKKFSQENNKNDGQKRNQSPKLFGALGGLSFNQNQRAKRFDEDPEILSLDFNNQVNLQDDTPPLLPKREQKREQKGEQKEEHKWQPLNSDVPVALDSFLVTDLEDEDPSIAGTPATGAKK